MSLCDPPNTCDLSGRCRRSHPWRSHLPDRINLFYNSLHSLNRQIKSTPEMWYWLWWKWIELFTFICTLNGPWDLASGPETPGYFGKAFTKKCDDFNKRWWSTDSAVLQNRHNEFASLLFSTDSSWQKQMVYWWANTTVLVPDPECQEWKNLALSQEFHEKGCNQINSKKQCLSIRRFLEHHIVDSSFLKEDKKRKTKAGNKIWWERVGEETYIYPERVRILEREETVNGEVISIEKPLWEESRDSQH